MAEKDGQVERLEQEAKGLRARLAQAEEVLRAIREGELEIAPGSDGSGSASTKPNLRLRLGQAAMRTVAQQLERKMRGQTADLRATVEQLQGAVRQRMATEMALASANTQLQMIGEVNEALFRAEDEQALMDEVCRIAVAVGGYRMAWVGFAQSDEGRSVRPVASMGVEEGYLARAGITWADNERGRGPTGTAIRTGRPQMGRNFLLDPELASWKNEAIRRGYQSSAALPLAESGRVFGAMNIYASQTDAFDEDRVGILQDMADNLAFGIMALRTRTALRERSEQLRALAVQLTLVEHRERGRMARVLHDHLQQLLVAAQFWIGSLEQSRAQSVRDTAAELSHLVDQALKASRTLTADLSPTALLEGGLAAGLEWLGPWMKEKHGLEVVLQTDGDMIPLTEDTNIMVFQAARELLFNVVKHSGVKLARVRMAMPGDRVDLEVRDEGAGFDPEAALAAAGASGFGLFSIRERAEMLGGGLQIDSAPGRGSCFRLTIPLRAPAAGQDERSIRLTPGPARVGRNLRRGEA
ncbi:MAG: GAF domain-containing sensor histidine kinase [Planctomycetota bacterium]